MRRDSGVPIRESQYTLKNHAPKKWCNSLLGLWRRHQHKPAVQQIYQSKLLVAQQLRIRFYAEHSALPLPVRFDNWYTQPACGRFLAQMLQVASVGTLTGDARVTLTTGEQTAVFLPNMETTVNLLLDGQPLLGERIVVFRQGIVGLLTTALLARFPLAQLVTVDRYPLRRQASLDLGAQVSLDPGDPDFVRQSLSIFLPSLGGKVRMGG